MEYDLRQWLFVLGPVLIIAILLHGYWRMLNGRNDLKMGLDKKFVSKVGEELAADDLITLTAELPNGGARFKKVRSYNSSEENPELGEILKPRAIDHKVYRQLGKDSLEGIQKTRSIEDSAQLEKSVILNVFSSGDFFDGQQLLEILVNLNMTFGERNIFHRCSEDGDPVFSLASAIEPGTFDLVDLESQKIPGVTMFMHVHKLVDPEDAYDKMLEVAETIAKDLDGLIKDETRSVVTAQTIEHCRQEIRDFQFRYSA